MLERRNFVALDYLSRVKYLCVTRAAQSNTAYLPMIFDEYKASVSIDTALRSIIESSVIPSDGEYLYAAISYFTLAHFVPDKARITSFAEC